MIRAKALKNETLFVAYIVIKDESESRHDLKCWYHRVILHAVEGMVTCCIY
jgi:hypothetical protein